MHCIILLPNAAGLLPTAQELRQRGFAVSEAVSEARSGAMPGAMPEAVGLAAPLPMARHALALASEASAGYGRQRPPER
jgi:hypothetical protein